MAPSASKIRLTPRDECCEEVCNQCRDSLCKLTVGFHTEEYHGGVQHRCKDFPDCEPYASESEVYTSESEESEDSGKTDVRDVSAYSEAPLKRKRKISKDVEESPASLRDPFKLFREMDKEAERTSLAEFSLRSQASETCPDPAAISEEESSLAIKKEETVNDGGTLQELEVVVSDNDDDTSGTEETASRSVVSDSMRSSQYSHFSNA